MNITELISILGGGSVAGCFITGVVKNRVNVPKEFRPLVAVVTGALAGMGISMSNGFGFSLGEVVAAAVAGFIAIGGRAQLLSVIAILRRYGILKG